MYLTGQSHVAAKAMVCTTMSAAAAVLGVTSLSLVLFQHVGTTEVINGVRTANILTLMFTMIVCNT